MDRKHLWSHLSRLVPKTVVSHRNVDFSGFCVLSESEEKNGQDICELSIYYGTFLISGGYIFLVIFLDSIGIRIGLVSGDDFRAWKNYTSAPPVAHGSHLYFSATRSTLKVLYVSFFIFFHPIRFDRWWYSAVVNWTVSSSQVYIYFTYAVTYSAAQGSWRKSV